MNEFFTWQMLGTLTGAAAATVILTQFLKGISSKTPTQVVSYIIALAVLSLATAATGGFAAWDVWALVPLNAVIVSLSANGAFSAVTRIAGTKDGEG